MTAHLGEPADEERWQHRLASGAHLPVQSVKPPLQRADQLAALILQEERQAAHNLAIAFAV